MKEFLTSAHIYAHTENMQTEMLHVSQKETQTEEVYELEPQRSQDIDSTHIKPAYNSLRRQ